MRADKRRCRRQLLIRHDQLAFQVRDGIELLSCTHRTISTVILSPAAVLLLEKNS